MPARARAAARSTVAAGDQASANTLLIRIVSTRGSLGLKLEEA